MKEELYVAPMVKVIEVEVEKGFAVSSLFTQPESLENGGTWS